MNVAELAISVAFRGDRARQHAISRGRPRVHASGCPDSRRTS